ncbi:hypothetical protein ZOSMA_44G00190 [Zostera marina]|uniref:Uncharacterized protein n=1 Tax=Zostera marina TaxID=29655 RepID=A0A0K9P338_ZOSMR|nr:hypothetical protein ZOSMA_44G00190 [Zostera marina]
MIWDGNNQVSELTTVASNFDIRSMNPCFLLCFFLLLAGSSSTDAVPLSRTMAAWSLEGELPNTARDHQDKNVDEAVIHGRMDIEQNDYPGSGANNRHIPQTPP